MRSVKKKSLFFLTRIPESRFIKKVLLLCTLLILKTGRVILDMEYVYEMFV